LVLNTSFNENEPVVCTPQEALDCFLRTKMDVLVIGGSILFREKGRMDSISLLRYNVTAFYREDGISLGAIFEGSKI
jgi:hypothetical protein